MTQKDGSPEASEGPYWSEELLAVLVVGLGDETQARDTLEGIIQQALSGKALQGISERQPTEQGGPLFRNAASTYNGYISECRGAGSVYVKYLAS